MFAILALILFLAWILGFAAFHVTAGFIHLLVILAVVSLIIHFVAGRRAI